MRNCKAPSEDRICYYKSSYEWGVCMEVREVYSLIGEDYAEIFSRFEDDKWIIKYLKQFCEVDYPERLEKAVARCDWLESYKSANILKSLAINLGFSGMADKSEAICYEMRNGVPGRDITGLIATLRAEYDKIINVLSELE